MVGKLFRLNRVLVKRFQEILKLGPSGLNVICSFLWIKFLFD